MGIQDMAAALAARDAGIESSAQHAEDVMPGWQDQAVATCQIVIGRIGAVDFTMEGIRNAATWCHNLPTPTDLRAWGAVTVRLIREGIIEKTGHYRPTKSSNGAVRATYRRGSK